MIKKKRVFINSIFKWTLFLLLSQIGIAKKINAKSKPKVVVLGAGFGGASCVSYLSNFTDLRLKRFRLRFEDLDCDNISIKASHLVRVHLLQQLVCQHLWRGELREESVRYEVPDVSCNGREFRR